MPDTISIALNVNTSAYTDVSNRRHNERRIHPRLVADRRQIIRRQTERTHCYYNEIESQLRSHGANHIEYNFIDDNTRIDNMRLKIKCDLPLDKLEEVKYIRGVEVVV